MSGGDSREGGRGWIHTVRPFKRSGSGHKSHSNLPGELYCPPQLHTHTITQKLTMTQIITYPLSNFESIALAAVVRRQRRWNGQSFALAC